MNETRLPIPYCDGCEYRGVPVEFKKGEAKTYCARTAMDNSVVLLRVAQGRDISMFPGPDEPIKRLPIEVVGNSVVDAYYDKALACIQTMSENGTPIAP